MAGAEVDADHGNGMTPLMFARMFGREEVAKVLEAAGANSAAKSRGLSIGQISLLMRFLRILAKPLLWLNPNSAIQRETAAKKPETQPARRLRDCI